MQRKLMTHAAALAAFLLLAAGCAKPPQPGVKKIPAGQEFSGFLKDYSNLKPNAALEGNALTFAQTGADKNIHRYIAIVVDPVEVYLASDADDAKVPEKSRQAVANYFRAALTKAVSDAFPPVDEPGPLVLRLRAAVIGVDAGGKMDSSGQQDTHALEYRANISKVGVELELVDSQTGEQIAAMVDRTPLGDGTEVASAAMTRDEKSAAARAAFDEWATRVRIFLNAAHELGPEDAKRAEQSYQPYSPAPTK